MRLLIALSLLVLALLQSLSTDEEIFKSFQKFIKKYKKTYNSPEEFQLRFKIFRSNYQGVELTNMFSEELDFTLKMNQFADLSKQEFEDKYLNLNVQEIEKIYQTALPYIPTIEDVPESLDWREHGAVAPVKNQGSCGSCWAFSAIANIEGQYFIQKKSMTTFSEQQLVDCDTVDQACNGGLMADAYDYLMKAGVMTDADYAYKGRKESCQFTEEKVVAKVKGYNFASSQDEEIIKKFLVESGPLAVALDATTLQFYFGGIVKSWQCPKNINHAVLLVGYGTRGNTPYWIVKNSWGKSWGEKGYFRIEYGKGTCAINTYVLSADVDAL